MALLEKLLVALKGSRLARDQRELKMLWHAGEPLAAGIGFYTEAFALVERVVGRRWRMRHSIQTNGTLVTPEWCELFRDRHVAIGVSLDGPAEFHDANRKSRSGRGSFAQAMRGVEVLRDHDISPSVLSVLTSESIDAPDEMFDFFYERGFRRVAFNVEEIEGPNLQSSLMPEAEGMVAARTRYRAFMARIAWRNQQLGWPLQIREFGNLARLVTRRRQDVSFTPVAAERQAGAILTMTRDGVLYSWSPELASDPAGALGRYALGNINDVMTVDELLDTARARELQDEIDRGIQMCRQTCAYFGVCGGGSPGNKAYERGTFATTETLKCALQTQELTEVMLDTFAN